MAMIKTGMLVVLYSAAVIIWLWDKPPAYNRLHRMIRFTVVVLGAR